MQFSYLESHATALERARLAHLMKGTAPPKGILDTLFISQNADGGWPAAWSHGQSSLDSTCFHLTLAEQLGLTPERENMDAALRFLIRRQALDGSWSENSELARWAPDRLKPGSLEARLYLTGNCGFWMAHYSGRDNAVPRAMGFLMRYLEENGCLPSYPPANYLSAGLWLRMRRVEIADRVISACNKHLATLSASDLAWMGSTMIVGRIRQKNPLILETAQRLLGLRKPGYYWESDDGPEWNCHTTIEALRVLKFTKNL